MPSPVQVHGFTTLAGIRRETGTYPERSIRGTRMPLNDPYLIAFSGDENTHILLVACPENSEYAYLIAYSGGRHSVAR